MTKYLNDGKKQQETLRGPFDIETHKQCFVNYLEVVIDEGGTVMYATPSHQEKMISIGCEKFNQSRKEFYDSCPKEYWLDVMTWLCNVTGCVPLWVTHMDGNANEKQAKAIKELYDAGLYRGLIVSKVNPYK